MVRGWYAMVCDHDRRADPWSTQRKRWRNVASGAPEPYARKGCAKSTVVSSASRGAVDGLGDHAPAIEIVRSARRVAERARRAAPISSADPSARRPGVHAWSRGFVNPQARAADGRRGSGDGGLPKRLTSNTSASY